MRARQRPGHFDGQWLERGQVVYGEDEVAELCGITRPQVKTLIKWFKKLNKITVETDNQKSIATIIDFDTYVPDSAKNNQQNGQQVTNGQPVANHIQQETSKKEQAQLPSPPGGASLIQEQWDIVARTQVATWNQDFPATAKGLRDQRPDHLAFVQLQRDEGKTEEDFTRYRAYLKSNRKVPQFWQRPRELTRPTKQGTGQELWAIIEAEIEAGQPESQVYIPGGTT
jgi:hypothetical protein